MSLSSVLKNRRKELNMTLLEVAKRVGVSEGTVQRWESGNIKNLRHERIAKLADVLDVSPAALMGWENASGETDLGLTAIDIAKWIGADPIEVSAIMGEMSFPNGIDSKAIAKIVAEAQKRKSTLISEDGLDDEKRAFIEKLKSMDSETVAALNKLADSIISKRGQ